jgi:hypothetical protein
MLGLAYYGSDALRKANRGADGCKNLQTSTQKISSQPILVSKILDTGKLVFIVGNHGVAKR